MFQIPVGFYEMKLYALAYGDCPEFQIPVGFYEIHLLSSSGSNKAVSNPCGFL